MQEGLPMNGWISNNLDILAGQGHLEVEREPGFIPVSMWEINRELRVRAALEACM
jgi:hypothetical protein